MFPADFPDAQVLSTELLLLPGARAVEAVAKANKVLTPFDHKERHLIALSVLSFGRICEFLAKDPSVSDFRAFGPLSPGKVEELCSRRYRRKGVHTKIHRAHVLASISLLKLELAADALRKGESSALVDYICDGVAFATRARATQRIHDDHVDEITINSRTHPLKSKVIALLVVRLDAGEMTSEQIIEDVLPEVEKLCELESPSWPVSDHTVKSYLDEIQLLKSAEHLSISKNV